MLEELALLAKALTAQTELLEAQEVPHPLVFLPLKLDLEEAVEPQLLVEAQEVRIVSLKECSMFLGQVVRVEPSITLPLVKHQFRHQ